MGENDKAVGAAIFLLLAQQGVRPDLEGWPSSEAEILALTGADPDETREMYCRLREAIPTLNRIAEESAREPPAVRLRNALAGFFDSYPDAIRDVDGNRVYSDEFRDFMVAMRDPLELGDSVSPEEVARAGGVPQDLYEEWVRTRRR